MSDERIITNKERRAIYYERLANNKEERVIIINRETSEWNERGANKTKNKQKRKANEMSEER